METSKSYPSLLRASTTKALNLSDEMETIIMRNPTLGRPVRLFLTMFILCLAVQSLTAAASEDLTLRQLYVSGNYREIAKRYRSADRIGKLTPEGRALLVNVLIPEHAGQLLNAISPVLSDDELANTALVAAIRSKGPVQVNDVGVRRLGRTKAGRLALALNARTLPPAPKALVPLREARLAVVERYFFTDSTPDARAEALQALVRLTTEAFKSNRFSPDVPAPPAGFAPKNITHFALKLAILPYLDSPDTFMSSFDAVSDSAFSGRASK